MEPEGSLQCSQNLATALYPETNESSLRPQSDFCKINFNIIFPSTPRSSKCSF
jgi:hypothetical protein